MNWSTSQSEVSLESILKLQERIQEKIEHDYLFNAMPTGFLFEPLDIKWVEPPQQPKSEAMAFRVYQDYAMKMFDVPSQILFSVDCVSEKPKRKNKALRIAALVAAIILFVVMWR